MRSENQPQVALDKNASRREHSEHAVERVLISADLARQLRDCDGSSAHVIVYAQSCDSVDTLRDP